MSYEVSVWLVEEFDDASALPDASNWISDGASWSYEGRGWILHAGPSEPVHAEDVPPEVCRALPGIAHVVHLNLEPIDAPKAGHTLLKKTAKVLSKLARGVILDPQADTVELPSGAKRFAPPAAAETRMAALTMTWWLDHGDLFEPARIERFLDLLTRHLPEALPRRYGLWEPPQHELAKTGRAHLVSFLADKLVEGIVWYAHRPVFHVSFSVDRTCGWRRLGDKMHYRCNRVSIEIDAEALQQPGWETSLRRLWRSLSMELRPFYGDVRSLGGHIRRSGRIWSDSKTEPHPVRSWFWKGIPPRLGHAAVFGDPYLALWPALSAVAELENELAFVTTSSWRSNNDATEVSGPVPAELALPFMAHWVTTANSSRTVLWPEEPSTAFPFGKPPTP